MFFLLSLVFFLQKMIEEKNSKTSALKKIQLKKVKSSSWLKPKGLKMQSHV
jgi:hypothetical protein